jgi:nucleoside-diphosphate-sugar epimerase
VRALVTGAGGFVGRHLTDRLRRDGWDVVGLTRRDVDLTDPVAAATAVRAADPDVVFSLAAGRAKATAAERAATIAVNTSPWLVDALPDRCRTVVRLGSSTEYAASPRPLAEDAALEPRGFFGASKAAGSLLLQAAAAERGVRAAVLRAFQVYGPGDHATRLVPVVLDAARRGTAVPLPARLSRRDWVWVGDVVDACLRAAADDTLPPGVVLNIGTGVQTSTEELVATASRVVGRPIATVAGAHPNRAWDTADWVCDPAAARRLLGWAPTVDLAEGLARTWAAS